MATYLKLTGKKQGKIKGGVIQKGREGQIEVHSLDHALTRADPTTIVAGPLGHGALRLTKRIDQSSPLLYRALVDAEPMTECTIDFWLPGKGTAAGETLVYIIKLSEAVVTGVGLNLADAAAPTADRRIATETISFAYTSIEWTWTNGSITASATH